MFNCIYLGECRAVEVWEYVGLKKVGSLAGQGYIDGRLKAEEEDLAIVRPLYVHSASNEEVQEVLR